SCGGIRTVRFAGRARPSRICPSTAPVTRTRARRMGRAMGSPSRRVRPPPRPEASPPTRRRGYLGVAPLLLLRNDVVLDLVVGGLRHDLLRDQLVLPLVWPVVDDLLRVGIPDAGHRLQLVRRGRIDVDGLVLLGVGGR